MSAVVTTNVASEKAESGNFLTRMPWYYQMAILVGLVGLLIYVTDALLYSDTRAETNKMIEQVQSLKAKNAQGSIIRQNLQATEQALAAKREEMDHLRDLLPDAVEISKVYDNVKDLMRNNKLELKQFAQDKAVSAEIYTAQRILCQISGSYDNLGKFFSDLGFYKRILSVSEVDIKEAEDNAQIAGRSINSAFVLTAYYISPENLQNLTKPPAPPQPAPGKAPAKPQPPANQPK
jgi:Tfp pilus assembly protein PilO